MIWLIVIVIVVAAFFIVGKVSDNNRIKDLNKLVETCRSKGIEIVVNNKVVEGHYPEPFHKIISLLESKSFDKKEVGYYFNMTKGTVYADAEHNRYIQAYEGRYGINPNFQLVFDPFRYSQEFRVLKISVCEREIYFYPSFILILEEYHPEKGYKIYSYKDFKVYFYEREFALSLHTPDEDDIVVGERYVDGEYLPVFQVGLIDISCGNLQFDVFASSYKFTEELYGYLSKLTIS